MGCALAEEDRFDAQEAVVVTNQTTRITKKAQEITLKVGEVKEIFRASKYEEGPEMAFYLPEEARSVVQLVVEGAGHKAVCFLKGIGKGRTVGGAVQRQWLDKEGFTPKSVPDEGRIQEAVKANPCHITVR